MKKTIYGRMEKGMDNLIKLTTSLRRKEFYICDFELKEDSNFSHIKITLDEKKGFKAEKAVLYLEHFNLLKNIQMN